jgi:hypothetical protein
MFVKKLRMLRGLSFFSPIHDQASGTEKSAVLSGEGERPELSQFSSSCLERRCPAAIEEPLIDRQCNSARSSKAYHLKQAALNGLAPMYQRTRRLARMPGALTALPPADDQNRRDGMLRTFVGFCVYLLQFYNEQTSSKNSVLRGALYQYLYQFLVVLNLKRAPTPPDHPMISAWIWGTPTAKPQPTSCSAC